MKEMAETMSARTGAEAIASFGQGRSWESAFRNLNQYALVTCMVLK